MSIPAFEGHWSKFYERLSSCNGRLVTELEGHWRDLLALLDSQLRQGGAASIPDLEALDLRAFQSARAETARLLFLEQASQWERKRPYRRALMAFETCDRSLEEALRSLPEAAPVSGPQALGALKGLTTGKGWRRLALLRRAERPLPLRGIVAEELRRASRLRAEVEGPYFLALAGALRQMKAPWEAACASLYASVQGGSDQGAEAVRRGLKASFEALGRQGEAALSGWRAWPGRTDRQVAERVLAGVVWRRKRGGAEAGPAKGAGLDHWAEQLRGVEAEVRLELDLTRAEDCILDLFRRTLEGLDIERAGLMAELDAAVGWLRGRVERPEGEGTPAFPPPKADLVPAASRLSELEALLRSEFETLPESCQTLARLSDSPRRRTRWRALYPRETLERAFARVGREETARVLERVEAEHRRVAQGVQQAREVVAFGLEAGRSEANPALAREALQNALSLLERYRADPPDWGAQAEARTARTLGAVFAECRLILSRRRLDIFAHLAQQGLRRTAALVRDRAAAALDRAARRAWRSSEEITLRFLVYIGWRRASSAGKPEVITRPLLPQEFTVDLSAKDLPALYRHLFRFEPVENPRFLVGRELEMSAIAEARAFWEAGRPVALLIVGERGSGKTSLINCALSRSLQDLEVLRGEFSRRLVAGPQMRGFLAGLAGVDDPACLESFLAGRRRVVILEELERTFLRQVGHYAAIRTLQRLIAATCSSTLWMLSINEIAFHFLDAAVNFGQGFSHRINASTARREDLRRAIMVRHNLSGLRLRVSSPPPGQDLASRLRRFVRRPPDPETLFFDTLAEESSGVFRTGFNIWLSHIEEVQAGALYMKPLSPPDLSPVIEDLDLDDLFTLVAILQHGSLTPEEHAAVFQKGVAASRAQIDELLTREIIEAEPGRPGFRVRPQTMRVVKEVLYRRNLL